MAVTLKPVPSGRATFLDAPRCEDLDRLDAHLAVIGVPYGMASYTLNRSAICSTAPQTIREQSLRYAASYRTHYDFDFDGDLLAGRQVKIVDCGDVPDLLGRFDESQRVATAAIATIVSQGAIPLVLGGEHSIPIPVLRGYQGHGPIFVAHVDAHLDWRDDIEGIREGLSSPLRRASEMPWVKGMAQIGLRGFGSARKAEVDAARAYGSILVGAEELHRVGIEEVLKRIPDGERYYLTIDADGLDPTIAPGVAGPAPGGVTYYEVTNLIKGLARKGRVVGYDFVEVVPSLDVGNMTSLLAARLILNLIGALAHAGQIG
ncbi:MAG TPA: agmatinase [Methylomirabilota bacterium]|nr:agmatinase [Methylomirabilota bacterium]